MVTEQAEVYPDQHVMHCSSVVTYDKVLVFEMVSTRNPIQHVTAAHLVHKKVTVSRTHP